MDEEETNQAETVSQSHDVPAVLRPLDGAASGGAARGISDQVGSPPQMPWPPHLSRAGRGAGYSSSPRKATGWNALF